MKNPLWKRIPKELISDIGKYLVIFLFMTASIGFISGFLVAANSMVHTYNNSFEDYNIENGHFELKAEITDELEKALMDKAVSVYDISYYDKTVTGIQDAEADSTLRIFKNRTEVNKVCIMEGRLPAVDDEIAIDRMYAENNNLEVGDRIDVDDMEYTISGYVALSDYSTMFSNNNDTMFDATLFGVAIVTDNRYEEYEKDDRNFEHFLYAWKYDKNEPSDDTEEKDMSEELLETIYKYGELETFVPRYLNQAIKFAGEDMGKDRSMMATLMYIIIAILAFIFAVTINNTISKEAATIGTLRASGYTRSELLIHYISLPVFVTIVAAIVGNILGYTVFKDVAAGMYYGSYSLTQYTTLWNADAFILTTAVPIIIMLVINLVIIGRMLKLSPLRFLRRDLSRTKRKKAVKLPHFKFFNRFRIRVILQNIPNYIMLVVGICFAHVLLMFGLMMHPLLDHFQEETIENMIAEYQYVLKAPVETENETAEKYCAVTLETDEEETAAEEITVFGINKDSAYFEHSLPTDGVMISDGYAEKYRLKTGDTIHLKALYTDVTYSFTISEICTYPSVLSVFINDEDFREIFEKDEEYFTGYFSDEELKDIDEAYIATQITREDLTKVSRQLDRSMGKMFYLVDVFAVVMFILLVYLLTKLIVERNTVPISMTKILGYENHEINQLYLMSTTIMVILSSVLGIVVARYVIGYLYFTMMKDFVKGWLVMWIKPGIYIEMFILSILCYVFVSLFQMRKIKRIPMDEALKNVE